MKAGNQRISLVREGRIESGKTIPVSFLVPRRYKADLHNLIKRRGGPQAFVRYLLKTHGFALSRYGSTIQAPRVRVRYQSPGQELFPFCSRLSVKHYFFLTYLAREMSTSRCLLLVRLIKAEINVRKSKFGLQRIRTRIEEQGRIIRKFKFIESFDEPSFTLSRTFALITRTDSLIQSWLSRLWGKVA